MLLLQAAGAYRMTAFRALTSGALRLLGAWCLAFLLVAAVMVFAKVADHYSRIWLATFFAGGLAALVASVWPAYDSATPTTGASPEGASVAYEAYTPERLAARLRSSVQEELQRTKPTGYTTVLKLLQIMADKGLVVRDEDQRAHVYHAAASRESTQRQLVDDLADRAFGGSAMALAMRALDTRRATRAELAEIRRLLDEHERRAR